jgi:hypothetical protein
MSSQAISPPVIPAPGDESQGAERGDFDLEDARQAGVQVEKLFYGALGAYGTVWRTLAEAISIALTAFVLGVAGAAMDTEGWAVLGALLMGVVVGLARKSFWPTLFGAPVGAFLGVVVGVVLWMLGFGAQPMIFSMAGLAVVGAWLGSAPMFGYKNWWGRLRPVFGFFGALLFVILGMLVGQGFQLVAGSLL